MFSKKATKIEKNLHRWFETYLVNVKSTVKIWSIFVAFLENMKFKREVGPNLIDGDASKIC